jgi:predicted membrane GTPase involved in stress response
MTLLEEAIGYVAEDELIEVLSLHPQSLILSSWI